MTLQCECGEVEGFEAFYARALMPAVRLAHLLTGSAVAGHDIAHDALTSVHERWDEIDNPDAYLRVVVANRAKNLQRRWIRDRIVLGRLRPKAVTSIPEFDDAWQALCRLGARQRAVVVLRFYEDLPISEIATVLDLPEGTVKSTLHRALRQLKELLS